MTAAGTMNPKTVRSPSSSTGPSSKPRWLHRTRWEDAVFAAADQTYGSSPAMAVHSSRYCIDADFC